MSQRQTNGYILNDSHLNGWSTWIWGAGEYAFCIFIASFCPLKTLPSNSSHCSTLQEGCIQYTAWEEIISIRCTIYLGSWQSDLGQKKWYEVRSKSWQQTHEHKHVLAHAHTYTPANTLHYSRIAALFDRAPVTCGEWTTLQAINTIIKHNEHVYWNTQPLLWSRQRQGIEDNAVKGKWVTDYL